MLLHPQDADLFFRLHRCFVFFVNEQLQIIPNIETPEEFSGLSGKLACPPEDIGNVGGYYDFLEALADPKHEMHEQYVEWGEGFDPEAIDADETTKAMQEGLPSEWE